ncbi:MAG: hypothetical protein J0L99_09895 [Chitinophagales bacterium]|nr:hypothetical protein [Chitinophagales bacterium]
MFQLLLKSFAVLALLFVGSTTLSAQVKVKIAPSIKKEVQKDGSLVLRSAKPMKVIIEGQKEPVLIGTIASLNCSCSDGAGSCAWTEVGCIGSCCGVVIGYHDAITLKVPGGGGGMIIISEDIADLKKQ